MTNRRSLGRGLHSLIPEDPNKKTNKLFQTDPVANKEIVKERFSKEILELDIEKIQARDNQPRKSFDDESIDDLAQSIEKYGLLNPIVVRKNNDTYEIVAGERRFRAVKKLGLNTIDAILKDYDQKDVEVLSLVENIQREDLKVLEEANAYKKLSSQYNLTQEEIAKTMGKSRSYIANTMRLLNLFDVEKRALDKGQISPSQARTLLSIEDGNLRSLTLNDFINGSTNIRKVEKRKIKEKKMTEAASENSTQSPNLDDILLEDLTEKLMDKLSSKVTIAKAGKNYKLTIDCYSIEDLEKIYEKL